MARTHPEPQGAHYTASGDAYTSKRQFNEAVIEYRRALAETPIAADVHYKLGRGLPGDGDLVNAYHRYAAPATSIPRTSTHTCGRHHSSAGPGVRVGSDACGAGVEGGPRQGPALVLLANARGGAERHRPGDADDPGGHQSRSVVRAGLDRARCNHLHQRPQRRTAAAFKKAGRAGATSIEARLALANYERAIGAGPEC